MILDALKNWRDYAWPSDRFRTGFEHLEQLGDNPEDDTYSIDGDDVRCIIVSYETSGVEEHKTESHRRYVDIQYLLSGTESILWAPTDELEVMTPYDDAKDVMFFNPPADPVDLVLRAGQFCVLLPQDAHAPGVIHGKPEQVRKAVIKVRL